MKKFATLVALTVLAGCNPAEMVEPTPPAPQAPTVTINVKQDSITAGQPVSIEICGTRFSQVTVSPGGFVVARCDTLTDYPQRPTRYRAFASGPGGNAQASDSVTVKQPTQPPAPTTATGWLTSNFYPTRVDSVWIYLKAGGRTTELVGKDLPYNITLPADSGLRIYWNSAKGHFPEPVSVVPMVGHPINEKAIMRPTPPAQPEISTTGWLRIVSVPDSMRVRITKLSTGDTVDILSGTSFEGEAGFYTAECYDPKGKYYSVRVDTDIDPGEYKTEVCVLPEKKPDEPPPAPQMYKLIVNSTPILGVNVTIMKYSDGSSVTTGKTRMERTTLADVYVVSCTMTGYLSYSEVVILNQDRTVNCLMWKEAEIPPPPTPTTGTLIVTDDIDGPVEAQVLYLLPNGEYKPIGAWLTDKVLVGQAPGEYIARCIKPGSKARIIGDDRVTLLPGGIATLRCKMGEKKDS